MDRRREETLKVKAETGVKHPKKHRSSKGQGKSYLEFSGEICQHLL